MNWSNWLAVAMLLFVATPAPAATGNVNFLLGRKALDSGDWNPPFDDQVEFGVLFDFRDESWPLNIAIDLLGSARTVSYGWYDETLSTSELDFGVRKVFDLAGGAAHPFIGGGLALASARLEASDGFVTMYTEDTGFGIWLSGGIYWTLGEHFNIGLQARYSRADVTIGGFTVDAGGRHTGVMLGYHW